MKSNIYLFLVSYIILFIIYIIFYYLLGLKRKTIKTSLQFKFISIRSGVDLKKLSAKKIGLIVCFIDPFIISFSGTISTLANINYFLALLIGFIMLLALIFSLYELLSRIIRKKEEK